MGDAACHRPDGLHLLRLEQLGLSLLTLPGFLSQLPLSEADATQEHGPRSDRRGEDRHGDRYRDQLVAMLRLKLPLEEELTVGDQRLDRVVVFTRASR